MTKDEELKIIASDCIMKTYEDIATEFSLNKEQVRSIFRKHKIKKKTKHFKIEDLSKESVEDIINNINNFSFSYFEKKYNTTEKVLRNLLRKHNITKVRVQTFQKENEWSAEELKVLLENYEVYNNLELCKLLPKRTEKAIIKKAHALGLYRESPWSDSEVNLLKKLSHLPYDNLAFLLERSVKAIKHKYYSLELPLKRDETTIECFVKNFLISSNVPFVFNTQLTKEFKYRPDFCITSKKVIIEVQGDYWHSNPLFYDDEDCTLKQIASREKDAIKKEYYESLGYTVVYVWESEIKTDPKNVLQVLNNLLCQEGPSKVEIL